MKTIERITEKEISYNYDNFVSSLIPFGSMDIRAAVTIALEIGEDGDWAAEQLKEFAESTDMNIWDLDPVCCVYDAILQEARNEIEKLTGFDFVNEGAEIYTYGNYCATSYDWSYDAPSIIKEKLIASNINFSELSLKVQWFLESIEANY